MAGVLIGFAIIIAVILVGYIVGRTGILGAEGGPTLSRIAFFVLNPSLLFTVLADADVHSLFSSLFLVSAASAAVCFALYLLIARLVLRRPVPEAVLGGTAASYVNAGNIGLPVASYVLGDPAFSVPVMLFQLVFFAPIVLTVLDTTTGGARSVRGILLRPLTNPMLIASVLGLVVALTGIRLPEPVLEPFRLIGGAAVPAVLIAFGISLRGQKPFRPGTGRTDVVLAAAIKLAVMPVVAFVLARFVVGIEGLSLFAVVVLAALPSAQNVFTYAQRYGRGLVIVRDAILVTTIGSIPVLVGVAALLA
jgi:predicted permease